jgi:glutamate-1-semialdehyde 2,1-aminomutase
MMVTHKVMHGGTYNAHPTCMAATVATLSMLADGAVHAAIAKEGARLMTGIETILRDRQIAGRVQGFPGIFHVALGRREPIRDYRDQLATDKAAYVRLTTAMLRHGVRALERGAWFLSATHDAAVVDRTLEAFDAAAAEALH